jgi:putative membrane protein
MKFLLKLLVSTIAVFISAYILPGVSVDTYTTALIVAVVLGVLNMFIRPLLVLLTLPITLVTLGLFYLFINAFLVYLATRVVPGFAVEPMWMTLVFGIVVSLINSFLGSLID